MNFSYFYPPSPSLTSLLPSLKPFLPKHLSYTLVFVLCGTRWTELKFLVWAWVGSWLFALFCIMVYYTTEKKMTPFLPANINSQYFLKEGFSTTCDKVLTGSILYRSCANKHSSSEFLNLVAVSHPEYIFRLALRHSTSNFRRCLFAALLPLTLYTSSSLAKQKPAIIPADEFMWVPRHLWLPISQNS